MRSPELIPAVELFSSSRKIFIASHIMPDGDSVGSQLALSLGLRQLGKDTVLSLDDRMPEVFSFLPGIREIKPRAPSDEDLFVYVDGSDPTRYARAFDASLIGARPVVNIDHHATNQPFATVNVVDPNAASTAEIVFDLLRELGVHISADIAQTLLTGIVTDTLGFRTAATTSETLAKATALVQAGGSIPEIVDRIYNRRSYNALRLLGHAIANSHLEDGIIWSQVDRKTLRELGVDGNGTSGIVNQLLTVREARIAFFLVEKEDGRIDVGLRARPDVDVSGVAMRLGGGGHRQAAGALLPPPFETAAARVLEAVRSELGFDGAVTQMPNSQ